MSFRTPPKTASIATPDETGKLVAPSAGRNVDDILSVLQQFAPAQGRALEIASGTGQQIAHFAKHIPALSWQPTDVDPIRLASIAAYVDEASLVNLNPPIQLDATEPGWSTDHIGQHLVLAVNILHLISDDEAAVLITEAAAALVSGGVMSLYGPFMRGGELTSEGDRAFHESLIYQDPDIGYKDDFDTLDRIIAAGCEILAVVEMPANNMMLIARRW